MPRVPKRQTAPAGYGLKAEELEPTFDRVLIEEVPAGKTPGGLFLPESCTIDQPLGIVRKVGPGNPYSDRPGHRPPCVEPGDVVLLSALQAVDLGGGLFLVRDREIICKLAKAPGGLLERMHHMEGRTELVLDVTSETDAN
jgi:co-chaperonin GroES (HSP10)